MEEGKKSRRTCAASDGLTLSKEGNKCYFNLTASVMQPHTKSQKVTLFSQRLKQRVERCFASCAQRQACPRGKLSDTSSRNITPTTMRRGKWASMVTAQQSTDDILCFIRSGK
jgi:hypothetical protein